MYLFALHILLQQSFFSDTLFILRSITILRKIVKILEVTEGNVHTDLYMPLKKSLFVLEVLVKIKSVTQCQVSDLCLQDFL